MRISEREVVRGLALKVPVPMPMPMPNREGEVRQQRADDPAPEHTVCRSGD